VKAPNLLKNLPQHITVQNVTRIYAIALALGIFSLITINIEQRLEAHSPRGRVLSFTSGTNKAKDTVVFGYLPYWKLPEVKFLQTEKLTDIAYFALHINSDGSIRKYQNSYELDPGYNQWRNSQNLKDLIAKSKETNTRVSLSVISHEDPVTLKFLDCKSCWKTLAREIVTELDYHGLKDLNLDFEGVELMNKEVATKYSELTAFLNEHLDIRYGESYVTVAAFADSMIRPRITNIEQLAKVSDGIFIMAYDFHQPTSDNAGPVAPIEGAGIYADYDISTMLKDYLTVAPPSKLILGVPYYGYNWVVSSRLAYADRVPGDDVLGYSTSQTYESIVETILETNAEVQWDNRARVPYFNYVSPNTGATRMVYFENSDSLSYKYNFAKNNNLGGVGIWALGYDGGYQELWQLLDKEFKIR
jgi:spore germination protein